MGIDRTIPTGAIYPPRAKLVQLSDEAAVFHQDLQALTVSVRDLVELVKQAMSMTSPLIELALYDSHHKEDKSQ